LHNQAVHGKHDTDENQDGRTEPPSGSVAVAPDAELGEGTSVRTA
jgi:hypothetical protein